MVSEFMIQPSSWIEKDITIQQIRGVKLFKVTDGLQIRFEELIDLYKDQQLSKEQTAELKGLQELDRVLTLLNAKAIADS